MTPEQYDIVEIIGLNLFFAGIFFFIGMAIKDVLNKGDVPLYGKVFVWLVLFLGCFGFVAKGLIQVYWEMNGLA
jgi:hypothetical protein